MVMALLSTEPKHACLISKQRDSNCRKTLAILAACGFGIAISGLAFALMIPTHNSNSIPPSSPLSAQTSSPKTAAQAPFFSVDVCYDLGSGEPAEFGSSVSIPGEHFHPKVSFDAASLTELMRSPSDLIQRFADDFGVSLSLGMFSRSIKLAQKRRLMDSSHYAGRVSLTFTLQEVQLEPGFVIDIIPGIKEALHGLRRNGSTEMYKDFFFSYGTHFANTITLGGSLMAEYIISASVFSDREEKTDTITVAAQATFNQLIGLPLADEINVSSMDLEQFKQSTNASSWSVQAIGGDSKTSKNWKQ